MADELTPAEIATLLAIIEGSRRRQAERIGAVEAGVRLAAEQVQDVRLRLLESPPPLDVSNLIIQVGLTLVFETNLLGWLSGKAASALLAPLVRMERGAAKAAERAARRMAPGQTQAEQAAVDQIRRSWLTVKREYPRLVSNSPPFQQTLSRAEGALASARQSAQQTAEREYMRLAAQAERIASTHSRFRDLMTRESNLNTGGGIQAAAAGWMAARGAGGSSSTEPASLEPGVLIQHQAAAWAAGWRVASDSRHDAFAQEARTKGLDQDDAKDMLDSLDPTEDLGSALEQLRDATSITIEALIWSQLFSGSLPPSPRFDDLARFQPVTPVADTWRRIKGAAQGRSMSDTLLVRSDIDPRLRDYLGGRFGPIVEAGAPPMPTRSPGGNAETLTAVRQARVLRWLAEVNDRYVDADIRFSRMLNQI